MQQTKEHTHFICPHVGNSSSQVLYSSDSNAHDTVKKWCSMAPHRLYLNFFDPGYLPLLLRTTRLTLDLKPNKPLDRAMISLIDSIPFWIRFDSIQSD